MTKPSKAEELLRRTFGNTTPMQSDERVKMEESSSKGNQTKQSQGS